MGQQNKTDHLACHHKWLMQILRWVPGEYTQAPKCLWLCNKTVNETRTCDLTKMFTVTLTLNNWICSCDTGSWWCTTVTSLVAQGQVVQKVLLDKAPTHIQTKTQAQRFQHTHLTLLGEGRVQKSNKNVRKRERNPKCPQALSKRQAYWPTKQQALKLTETVLRSITSTSK